MDTDPRPSKGKGCGGCTGSGRQCSLPAAASCALGPGSGPGKSCAVQGTPAQMCPAQGNKSTCLPVHAPVQRCGTVTAV